MSNSMQDAPRRRPPRRRKTWQRVLFHWRLPLIIVLILMVLTGVLVHAVSSRPAASAGTKQETPDQTAAAQPDYPGAVVDALEAKQTEIHELVCLTQEDGRVTYDAENDRVQLVFWVENAEGYGKGSKVTLDADQYAYADLELAAWGEANKDALRTDKAERLKELFGLPKESKGAAFVLATVTPERVLRPAYQPDAQLNQMSLEFEETVDQEFRSWFDRAITQNYLTTPRPWTRLGYTYDWGASGDDHYGVTEFVIPSGTKVTVQQTFTNDEMITRLRKGKLE